MARRGSLRNLGLLLLAVYLIVVGISPILGISLGIFVNLLAVIAGIALLDLR
jgi:hypothetical protein